MRLKHVFNKSLFVYCSLLLLLASCASNKKLNVIAYYAGRPTEVDSFAIEKLTHIIFSFSHLDGNRFHINNASDTLTIQKLVALKSRNPRLKVMLSLGGWGGCQTCSDVFSTNENRKAFALSVKESIDYFNADGIDLDWEYPALPSIPGHSYKPEDKQNFTALIKELRKTLGWNKEISFAAGAGPGFLEKSIEWNPVMKKVDRVNVMTYDFYSGDGSGHHTALYSTPTQKYSADYSIQALVDEGIPSKKIVIGAAFYARVWDSIPSIDKGMNQPAKLKMAFGFRDLESRLPLDSGYVRYRDTLARAPYIYNPKLGHLASYDDEISVKEKTEYALKHKLNGIMFWQLTNDKYEGGLLDVIWNTRENKKL
jgi:chitinase